MTKTATKAEKPDARGGRFLLLPHCLVTSEAFRTASPRAIKVLLVLWQHHSGFNNGRIGLGFRDLAQGMDSQFHKGNIAAVGELIGRGIVAVSTEHPKAKRLAREYRLTFIPTKHRPATHDYLAWREGDAGSRHKPMVGKGGTTRKNGIAKTATETSLPIAETATAMEETVAYIATRKFQNDANPPFRIDAPVAVTTTHIVNQSTLPVGIPKCPAEIIGRVASAAPDADELRARIVGLVERHGRGTQGKLAKQAAVSGASMSRFLKGTSDLDERSRMRLTLAIPKVEWICTGAPPQRASSVAAQ